MSFPELINHNGFEVLTALISANFIAQVFKTVTYAMQHGELHLRMLFTTGGMPSSHSAAVTAMSVSIGLIEGFSSSLFALSFCVASIVMYDAAGIRRSAGRQAQILNQIITELFSQEHHLNTSKLKELLGHTPSQVVFGGLLGIAVSLGLRYYLSHTL